MNPPITYPGPLNHILGILFVVIAIACINACHDFLRGSDKEMPFLYKLIVLILTIIFTPLSLLYIYYLATLTNPAESAFTGFMLSFMLSGLIRSFSRDRDVKLKNIASIVICATANLSIVSLLFFHYRLSFWSIFPLVLGLILIFYPRKHMEDA